MSSKMTWYRSFQHRQAFKSQILRLNRYGYISHSDILKDVTNFNTFIINVIHINSYKIFKNTKKLPKFKIPFNKNTQQKCNIWPFSQPNKIYWISPEASIILNMESLQTFIEMARKMQ